MAGRSYSPLLKYGKCDQGRCCCCYSHLSFSISLATAISFPPLLSILIILPSLIHQDYLSYLFALFVSRLVVVVLVVLVVVVVVISPRIFFIVLFFLSLPSPGTTSLWYTLLGPSLSSILLSSSPKSIRMPLVLGSLR